MKELLCEAGIIPILESYHFVGEKAARSIERALWNLKRREARLKEKEGREDLTKGTGTIALFFPHTKLPKTLQLARWLTTMNLRTWPRPPDNPPFDPSQEKEPKPLVKEEGKGERRERKTHQIQRSLRCSTFG